MTRFFFLLLLLAPARADELLLDNWQGLRPDPALPFRDRPSFFWPDIAGKTSVACQDAPEDWTPYASLSFWAHSEKPAESRITLVISSENPATKGSDYFSFCFPTNFKGWRRFVLARDSLSRARQPLGWDKIKRVFFSSNWAHRLDPGTRLHLAQVTLDTQPLPGMQSMANELLRNRSFEIDGNYDGTPDAWSASSFRTGALVQLDHEVAHEGRRSVRIDGRAKSRAGLSVGFGAEVTDPRQVYLLSAWVKVQGKSSNPLGTSARITSVNASGRVLKSDYRHCAPGPYGWRRYQWLVSLPEDTVRFNLVLFHHGEGTAWWDDVSMVRARPVKALSPSLRATVPDGRPAFRWQFSGSGELRVSRDPAFDPAQTRVFPVSGAGFTPPDPLLLGKTWHWIALFKREGPSAAIAVFPGTKEQPFETGRFFAGTWQQRCAPLREKTEKLKPRLAPLEAFARRNHLWDPFSLLGQAIEKAGAIASTKPDNPAEAEQALADVWKELKYTLPWWDRIFLDDGALFSGLNLTRPGLEKVQEAVAGDDFSTARTVLLDYYRLRKKPTWYGRYEQPPFRRASRTTDHTADQYLTHKMPIHSYKDPVYDLGRDFDWHVFPILDVEWPTKIHRHFHWSAIAGAYWQTGNEKYAEELKQQLFDWAKDNPMEHWDRSRYRWAWSTLNATVRIYSSWIRSWLQIRNSKAWNADAQFVFLTELREHGRFLMSHAAKTGNWVVAEARGLVELGVMFPEFKEAKAWREEGFRRLQHELQIQVLADGVHVERTPGYHSMTMSCFMEPVRLGLLNGIEDAGLDEFVRKIEKMHEFYLYGAKPNLRMPQIGDAGPMAVNRFLRRGFDMFRRDDMRYVLTGGKEGSPPVVRSYAFDAAGFYVSRSAWCDPNALWSILDWGGFLGHCHDDMGHICLYAYGADLLIDTGRYSYAWPMRAPFHETVGHSTVMVDRKTQKRRDPLEADWVSTSQFDAFRGQTDNSEPLRHKRTFIFRQPGPAGPGYWLCVDYLTGKGQHRLDQRWQTSEKMKAEIQGSSVLVRPRSDPSLPSLTLANLAQSGLKTEIAEGAVSYAWYKKIPIDVAQFTLEGKMPARFIAALVPSPPGLPVPKVKLDALPLESPGQASAVAVTITDRTRTFSDLWLVRHDREGEVKAGSVRTDARQACVRQEGGRWTAWMLASGSFLELEKSTLFKAEGKTHGAGAVRGDKLTQLVCTRAKKAVFAVPGKITLNGLTNPASPENGHVTLLNIEEPERPTAPRAPGKIHFEIEPPPPPRKASTILKILARSEPMPRLVVKAEAEDFAGQAGGEVTCTSTKIGASGKAFLHWDNQGHWLEWKLSVPAAGKYQLLIRACTAQPRALRKLTLDGKPVKGCDAMEFASTGGYSNNQDDWLTFAVTSEERPVILDLGPGETTVRLENIDGNSLNLDWLGLARVK